MNARTLPLTLMIMIALQLFDNNVAYAKCGSDQQDTVESLAAEAESDPDPMNRSLLLRKALQLCQNYDLWIRLGEAQASQGNWVEAADAYSYARDYHIPNESGEYSVNEIRDQAAANALLAQAYWESGQQAPALSALEEAKTGYEVIGEPIPARLLELQGKLDDALTGSDASVLADAITLQRTRSIRGIGLRPKIKPAETSEPSSANNENQDVIASNSISNQAMSAAPQEITPVADSSQNQQVQARINIQILFATNSDQISADGLERMTQLIEAIEQLSLDKTSTIRVVGHTDSRGSEQLNLDLSRRRARTVVDHLSESGVVDANLEVVGMGESQLRYPGNSADHHRRNRRVELMIVK